MNTLVALVKEIFLETFYEEKKKSNWHFLQFFIFPIKVILKVS